MTQAPPELNGLKRLNQLNKETRSVGVMFSVFCLLFVASAGAITIDGSNPYRGIVDRNVFGLKDPPPPPPPNPDANKPPAPPVTRTGISTIGGIKRAFMTLQLPAKPPEPAKAASLMLTEGQRDGEVEVLQIDEKEKIVKVNSYGSITNLSFEKNGAGAKGSGAGATPVMAGGSGIPAPANVFSPGSSSGPRTIPTRMVRLPGGPGAASANPGAMTPGGENPGGSPAFTPGSTSASSVTGFTPGGYTAQPKPDVPLTPAQQEVLMEAAHQAAVAKGDPTAAIYPPSFLNPTRNVAPTPESDPNAAPPPPQQKFPSPRTRPY